MECIGENHKVSVIIPIHDGEAWIDECFTSILQQTAIGQLPLEISVYDDASTDKTWDMLQQWKHKVEDAKVSFIISKNSESQPKGVGFAKNRAVDQSTGHFLCFQDVDDIMLPDRILHQYKAAQNNTNAIVGSGFRRFPEDSTLRFTKWANGMDQKKLYVQIYTSHGPTLIMPTWFCSRDVFDR
ncbi:UDP-GlcNAc:betaGal beta-1 [Blattella germanica]|nr:UDP-GlcNAc:betaGal beta-1 [Blattella germanica]